MPQPTIRAFVSSTWLDLEPERKAVEAALQRMRGPAFAGMEYFGARDETTRRASLDEVDRSDVYVGIFAARYGSGITEAEYRRARKRGLPCLIYFKTWNTITLDKAEKDPDMAARLEVLKDELRREHTVVEFDSPADLAAKVTADLHRLISDRYSPKEQPTEPAAPALNALHQLRAPVGDFVGRAQQIAELTATLRGGTSAAISGISGMGGIGKTELALFVAGRLRDAYPDAQLVIDMRGTDDPPRDPADALAACIRAFLGLEQKLPDDLEELTRLYRSVLEGKRALILLDNASDGAQVRPLLPPPGSALLITSRNAITLPRMTRVTLDQLSPTEARELLTGIAPRVPPDVADQICYLCGYLPLAIRAAGSLLDITVDLDPSDYAAQLSDERTRLARIGTEGVDVSVEASFKLSYDRLESETACVYRQLAAFPATFDAKAEEAVCEDESHKHLSELVRRSLVIYNPDTARYRLHDLARLFIAARLSEGEQSDSQKRHAGYYLSVLQGADWLYGQGGDAVKQGLALFDLEWRNIHTGQSWAEQHSVENNAAAWACMHYPSAGMHLLYLRQHPREQIRWLEAAVAAARRLNEREAEGVHLGNLGLAYFNLGETRRAIELHERGLVIMREAGNRRGEGTALGNLGLAYSDLGELRRAIEFYEQRLVIAREVSDRRGEGYVLGNLGNAYADLGETRRAVEFYEQVLEIAREMGDLFSEGNALGNLGVAYKELGELRRAIEFYEQYRDIAREIGDRRGEGIAHFNTGLALYGLGDREQAITHAEKALEIFSQLESPYAEHARAALARWRRQA